MKDIMIATGNKNKTKEYRELLEPLGYKVHDLSEIEHTDPQENGTSFTENAIIKAKAVKTDMMVIADDSGLEIKALNNEPGIYSARYLAGHDYTYKNNVILERMKGVKERDAKFSCAIALIDGDKTVTFLGELLGDIAEKIEGNNGFGYDPIFIPKGYQKTTAAMPEGFKNQISHRAIATKKLLEYLNKKD